MSEQEIQNLLKQADELGAYNIVFTGGEPTLLGDRLPGLLRFIRQETSIKFTRLVTNGHWATTYARAHAILRTWKDAGLDEINVSCGEYHQQWVPYENVANAYRAGVDLDFMTVLCGAEVLPEGKGEWSARKLQDAIGFRIPQAGEFSPFLRRTHGIKLAKVMRFGRGEALPSDCQEYVPEAELPDFCAQVLTGMAAHPDGAITACCGVMARDPSPLTVGNWRQQSLREITDDAQHDVILNWIRFLGLKEMKRWLQEKDSSLQFCDRYGSTCELCCELIYNPRCTKLLKEFARERADDVLANRIAREVQEVMAGAGPRVSAKI